MYILLPFVLILFIIVFKYSTSVFTQLHYREPLQQKFILMCTAAVYPSVCLCFSLPLYLSICTSIHPSMHVNVKTLIDS